MCALYLAFNLRALSFSDLAGVGEHPKTQHFNARAAPMDNLGRQPGRGHA